MNGDTHKQSLAPHRRLRASMRWEYNFHYYSQQKRKLTTSTVAVFLWANLAGGRSFRQSCNNNCRINWEKLRGTSAESLTPTRTPVNLQRDHDREWRRSSKSETVIWSIWCEEGVWEPERVKWLCSIFVWVREWSENCSGTHTSRVPAGSCVRICSVSRVLQGGGRPPTLPPALPFRGASSITRLGSLWMRASSRQALFSYFCPRTLLWNIEQKPPLKPDSPFSHVKIRNIKSSTELSEAPAELCVYILFKMDSNSAERPFSSVWR